MATSGHPWWQIGLQSVLVSSDFMETCLVVVHAVFISQMNWFVWKRGEEKFRNGSVFQNMHGCNLFKQ